MNGPMIKNGYRWAMSDWAANLCLMSHGWDHQNLGKEQTRSRPDGLQLETLSSEGQGSTCHIAALNQ